MAGTPISSTHPPLPPTTEDDRVAWLRLLRSRRVGIATFFRLMSEHGSAQAAIGALPALARDAGLDDYEPCPLPVARAEMATARKLGAKMLTFGSDDYPAALTDIPDPPPILWAIGDTGLLNRPAVALVGARNASSLGLRMARRLSAELGRSDFVVASGLARGVDTAAHLAALDSGTIAVMAGGVDVIYPAENTRLGEDIAARGLRISEQPPGLVPQSRHFPMRNRLISGLSRAVVVVEAAAKSGSLITARDALDQGREVLAVPGHPMDGRAAGCNHLIRDGARLVRSAEDVIEAIGTAMPIAPEPASQQLMDLPASPPQQRSLRQTAALHSDILARIGPSPMAEDQLIRDIGLGADQIAPALTDLELDGKIARKAGGLLARTDA